MKLIFFTCALLCIYACTKTDFESNNFESKLFLNAILDTKNGLNVKVLKTADPYKTTDLTSFKVSNTKISLYEDGLLLYSSNTADDGTMVNSKIKPKSNAKYVIKAENDGFPIVVSDTIVFPITPIVKEIKKGTIEANEYGSKRLNINFQLLKSNPSKEQFYMLETCDSGSGFDILFPSNIDCTVRLPLFSSRCFLDDLMTLKTFVSIQSDEIAKCILVSTTTKDYYDYLASTDQPFAIEWLFAEAKSLYSNMHGGYGVFLVKNTKEFNISTK